jgi:hypothetical protein
MTIGDGLTPCYTIASSSLPLGASSGNVAASTATATITPTLDPSMVGVTKYRTAYISGFELTGAGATAASVIVGTITGLAGGTLSYVVAIPAGVTSSIQPLIVEFCQPLAASSAGQAIAVSFPSFGAGNTNACVNIHGFQV